MRKRQMIRRVLYAACAAAILGASGLVGPPGAQAYGGGADHDMWQIGVSGNCNNPSFCGDELGGLWCWLEFDRAGTSTWGDAKLIDCGHFLRGGGSPETEIADVDITAWHIGPAQPGDLTYPGGQVFYIDGNVVNGKTNLPDYLGDFAGIPAQPGRYAIHPVAGVAGMYQVTFRPAK
jgi:hypothetical protein